MTLDRADVEAALQQKGFVGERGDHRYYTFYHGGKKTAIFTKVSHGTGYKRLGDRLVSDMARQVKLTTKQFGELVSCSLTAKAYVAVLQARGALPK